VDRLERQGFVARSRPESDRRRVLASITPAGRAMVEDATGRLNAEVFERPGLPHAEVLELTGLLHGLRAAAGDSVATSPAGAPTGGDPLSPPT
jgi:DNA-binding MarR family transcriptional regulator